MIEFLVDNIYVRFGGQLFRQMVGIPMGTNCAPLLADLFLYSYENEFLDKLIKDGKRKLARKFNLSYRYTDDLISFNNKRFKEFISDIYPKELTISETTESTSIASYLNLLFIRDKSNNITTKLYDKRDAFGFHIVNFPFMSNNILSSSYSSEAPLIRNQMAHTPVDTHYAAPVNTPILPMPYLVPRTLSIFNTTLLAHLSVLSTPLLVPNVPLYILVKLAVSSIPDLENT